jgi:hypothetical protein
MIEKNVEKCKENYLKAVKIREKLNDLNTLLNIYYQLTVISMIEKNMNQSLEFSNKCLNLSLQLKNVDSEYNIRVLLNEIYSELKDDNNYNLNNEVLINL